MAFGCSDMGYFSYLYLTIKLSADEYLLTKKEQLGHDDAPELWPPISIFTPIQSCPPVPLFHTHPIAGLCQSAHPCWRCAVSAHGEEVPVARAYAHRVLVDAGQAGQHAPTAARSGLVASPSPGVGGASG